MRAFMTDTVKDRALVVFCHPDDEVLFLGPILEDKKYHKEFYCLTCGDNPIRRSEFKSFMNTLRFDYNTMGCFPIVRGFKLHWMYTYYRDIVARFENPDLIVTHTIYGDEHFHPQHVMLALPLLMYCIRNRVNLVCYGNPNLAFSYLKESNILSKSSIPMFLIKLLLLITHKFLFRRDGRATISDNVRRNATLSYRTQDLNYKIFEKNEYQRYKLRILF